MNESKKKIVTARTRLVALLRLVTVSLALLPGTVTNAGSSALSWSEDHKLSYWMQKDLTPYLAETLSQHPRFKGEPLRFVSVEGDKIREDMDDLTREMIQHLRHALQKTQGINLVWQGDEHADVPCYQINEPEYHVAIEFVALGNHRYRVAVRALDVRERSWVSGFGHEWQGALSRSQRIALARRDAGGALLGLRNYPYTEAQADLLAKDLARTLTRRFCGFVGEPLVVYTEADEEQPALVKKTIGLVGNYLTSSQDVVVTADPGAANVVVSARIVPIDKGLHQFWIMARPVQRDLALPDIDTQAYVRLAQQPRAPVAAHRAPMREPVSPPVVRDAARADILSSVSVITPPDRRNCRSADPWRFGGGISSRDNTIAEDGCFAIEMRLNRDGRVFLINFDPQAGLVRLLPSSCQIFGHIRTVAVRGESVRFPSQDKGTSRVLTGPGRRGSETFFAIAVSDRRAAERIDQHVANLRDACDIRHPRASDQSPLQDWLRDVKETVADLGSRAQWQILRVNYVPRGEALASRD